MARSGRGNTFDFVAKFFYACSILCFIVSAVIFLQYASPFIDVLSFDGAIYLSGRCLACSVVFCLLGVLFQGLADIVHHLMSISQNTRETARKLQEMSVPRDSENPPLP